MKTVGYHLAAEHMHCITEVQVKPKETIKRNTKLQFLVTHPPHPTPVPDN